MEVESSVTTAAAGDRGGRGSSSPPAALWASLDLVADIPRYVKASGPKKLQQHVDFVFFQHTSSIRSMSQPFRPGLGPLLSFCPAPAKIGHQVIVGITVEAASLTQTSCHCRREKSVGCPCPNATLFSWNTRFSLYSASKTRPSVGPARQGWCGFSFQSHCFRAGKGARWAAAMMMGLRREFQ